MSLRPALMIKYLYSQTPIWQHAGFDELARKTSFSKLADIKYTWSLPSPFLWQAREGPRSEAWAAKNSPQAERILLFVCLGPVSISFGGKQPSKNCRNVTHNDITVIKGGDTTSREDKSSDFTRCLMGFSLFFYLIKSFLLSYANVFGYYHRNTELESSYLEVEGLQRGLGAAAEWCTAACSETTGEQTPNKQALATNSNQLESADALLRKWWSRAANTFQTPRITANPSFSEHFASQSRSLTHSFVSSRLEYNMMVIL